MLYTINFALFVLLSFIWGKGDSTNLMPKLFLFGIACANAFCALQSFGYLNR